MFRWLRSGAFWGALLILGGVLFLLENLGILEIADIYWAFILGLTGVFFFAWYFNNRDGWWALIPGFIFSALGIVLALQTLFPGQLSEWTGGIFLAGIGLPFLVIYLLDRQHWWALIPAGVLFTLAVVAVLDNVNISGLGTGGVFFIGLGLTFALVALAPTPSGRMKWAWIPSLILVTFGILVFASAEERMGILGPAALIVGGLALLLMAFRPRRS